MSKAPSTPVPGSGGLRFEHLDRRVSKPLRQEFKIVVEVAEKTARDVQKIVAKGKRA